MEFDPQAPTSPEHTDGDRDKRTKRKKRGRFAAPIPLAADTEKTVTKEAKEAKQPERSVLDEALANLAIKRRENEAQPEAGEQKTSEPEPAEAEVPMGAADSAEDEPAPDEATYEPLLVHELKPTEFSGGEVIIELQGDKPVVERIAPASDGELPLEAEEPEAPELPVFAAVEPEHVASSSEPEPVTAPVTTGGGEAPPHEPPENPSFNVEPTAPARPVAEVLPPEQPALFERPAVQADMYPYAPATEQPATSQDVKNAVYRAEKAGQNRGVLAGAMFYGALEHFRHRRREKRLEKRLKKQDEQFTQDREDRHFYYDEQTKQQAAGERRLQAVEQQDDRLAPSAERLPAKTAERLPAAPEAPEQPAVPDGHRLETSAWHSIEIDNKTGKPAENPAFAYGHEYYRERAQEATPAQERNAAAGEVALVAAAAGQNGTANESAAGASSGTPNIPSASTQGPPPSSLRSGIQSARRATASDSGPLWPWFVALAVVILCLILVIH